MTTNEIIKELNNFPTGSELDLKILLTKCNGCMENGSKEFEWRGS